MSAAVHPHFKILIIEDNETDAFLLQETLKGVGSSQGEQVVAGRLDDAMRLLERDKFDIILLDLSLPDSHGFETFVRLYQHAPQTPIVILTGFEDESLGLDAVRAGAQEYIVKGTLNGKALWRVISYAIQRHSLGEALKESEQRYKRLLGSVTDYIYTVKIVDGHAVSTVHGPGCLTVTGYAPHDLDGDPHLWYRMVHGEDQPLVRDQAAQVLAGKPYPLEHRIVHKDGSIRWVRHTPVLRVDEQNRITSYDGLISDITGRKRAEDALRQAVEDLQQSREELKTANLQLIQAEKMETVGRMAAGVAHEVKNPLGILLMSLDYLSLRLTDRDESLESVLTEMRNAARRADTIIHGLLDFSASDELELKITDLNPLVEKTLLFVRHNLAINHVKVQSELLTDLARVAIDSNKIEQVLVNLLTNAIDAMPDGGTVTVRSRMERLSETYHDPGAREASHFYAGDRVVVLEVDDTGTGVPPEVMRKIFDPFFTTKATGKGTGLGLAIVRRIIDLHGGKIELINRPEGGVRCKLIFRAKD